MGRREGRVCLGRERVAIKNEQGKIPVKRKKKKFSWKVFRRKKGMEAERGAWRERGGGDR